MKCIAVDSDPMALNILEEFCLRLGIAELVKFTDPAPGYRFASSSRPDLVFLDISGDGVAALQIASGLPPDTCVIFTSSSLEFAAEGFNLDIVDYLHKPFSFNRFKRAVIKAERRMNFNAFLNSRKSVIVKQEYNNVPVVIADILFVEAMENYSKIHTLGGKSILAHNSLKNILALLRESGFIRIHKSYIIPTRLIESFTRSSVTLSSGTVLPVGRQFAPSLFQLFS